MNFELSDEQELIRRTVREFAETKVAPVAEELDREARFPRKAIDAARAKATVGEISDAMEKVFGRHRAEIKSITGVYKREASAMSNKVAKVQALIEDAHKICPYSRATRGNVPVTLTVG